MNIASLSAGYILKSNTSTDNNLNSYYTGDNEYDIEVYNIQGKKVMELTGNTIDMSHLSSATYIVKILDKVENESEL